MRIRTSHAEGELTEAQIKYATPDPNKMVLGPVTTQFRSVLTDHGMRAVPETFQVIYERQGTYGFSTKTWRRYKDRPDEVVPQFSLEIRDKPVVSEPLTKDEIAAYKAQLPHRDPPIPDPPPRPAFEPADF